MKIIVAVFVLFLFVLLYSLCKASSIADEREQVMFEEFEEKRKE